MTGRSRRQFLRATGLAVAPLAPAVRRAERRSADEDGWTTVETPTQRTLHDVARPASGAYAVGAGGIVLERGAEGWSTVTENGPTGNGNNLASAATTADGKRLWMAGASGVVAEYDPSAESMTSHSAPDGVTNNFTDVAVTGSAGEATVYLVDASGRVHVSARNGREGTWTHATPGSGAEISAISVAGSTAVFVDQNDALFETTDGTTWREVPTPDFDETLNDVALRSAGTVVLAGDDGTVVVGSGGAWEQEAATDEALNDVDVAPCGCVHAVGESGTVLHRRGHGTPPLRTLARVFDWWTETSPTGQNLHAVTLGHPHLAVGAGGTILERES